MDKLKNASFKTKLILSILIICVFSISVTLAITLSSYKVALDENARHRLSSILNTSKNEVSTYYAKTRSFSDLLASDRLTEGLFLAYESAFYAAGYSVGKDVTVKSDSFAKLDTVYKGKALDRVKFYDIANFFLVNINGQVVFSAKENDLFLGKNLNNGQFKASLLSKCVQGAKGSNSKNIFYSDFEYFPPSKETLGFFCVNAFSEFAHLSEGISKGDLLGTVVVQINLEDINRFLMNNTANSEKVYIKNTFDPDKRSGELKTNDLVREVVPMELESKHYELISENKKTEIYAPLYSLLKKVFAISTLVIIVVFACGIYLIKTLTDPIMASSLTLSEVCRLLSKDSTDLLKSANTLDESARDQAENLQSTAQAISEIASTIEQNTSNATNTEKLARACLDLANNGRIVMEQMVQTMEEIDQGNHDILDQVDESNKKISEILVMISEIENKTNIINDIVFQTKLLSFNASVEAARAGEHGKGFAVVSEEIGKLAATSGASAKDITLLLTESISKVDSIISETKEKMQSVSGAGQERVKKGQESTERCLQLFEQMNQSFNQVAKLVIEISRASLEQNSGMIEINQAMNHLNAGTDKTNQIASESNMAAHELESRAKTLESVVNDISKVLHGA